MVTSSALHNNSPLKWTSALALTALIYVSGLLALRFGNSNISQNDSGAQDIVKVFFADQPGFVLQEITSSDIWNRTAAEIESNFSNLILFSINEKLSQQFIFLLKRSYLQSSYLIRPGLLISEMIYPFHSHL